MRAVNPLFGTFSGDYDNIAVFRVRDSPPDRFAAVENFLDVGR